MLFVLSIINQQQRNERNKMTNYTEATYKNWCEQIDSNLKNAVENGSIANHWFKTVETATSCGQDFLIYAKENELDTHKNENQINYHILASFVESEKEISHLAV